MIAINRGKLWIIILFSLILIEVSVLSSVMSYFLTSRVLIRNEGSITVLDSLRNKSEIRIMFVHCTSFPADWSIIADISKQFNFNVINVEIGSPGGVYYKSSVAHDWWVEGGHKDELAAAIREAHLRGLKVWANFDFMAKPSDEVMSRYGEMRAMGYDPNTRERSYVDWTCPSNPNSKRFFHDLAAELATNYDIDGLMFDYIRYDYKEMCFCDYCKQKFIEDTGLTDVNWPTDVYNGGRYEKEFMEWRVKPITEIVENVTATMRSIKPNIEFALAAWAIFDDNAGPYWRYYIGQDAADWINRGLIEYVSPMIYDADINSFTECVENCIEIFTGAAHGKIPIVPSITTGITEPRDTALFAQQVSILRNYGCDGFQVWRYGGEGSANSICDVRDYLSQIDLPETFSLSSIEVSVTDTTATITWLTSKPATSKVEYNTSLIFPGVTKLGYGDFPYWDIEYIPGITVENATLTQMHKMVITGLNPKTTYYFRVQSKGLTGIVTSKELTFKTY